MLQDGLVVSLVSILVVFFGMALIITLVAWLGDITLKRTQKKVSTHLKPMTKQEVKVPADVSSAIAMAIYLHKFFSEEEHHMITIQKSTIPFSPWVTKGRNSVVTQNNTFYGRRK